MNPSAQPERSLVLTHLIHLAMFDGQSVTSSWFQTSWWPCIQVANWVPSGAVGGVLR